VTGLTSAEIHLWLAFYETVPEHLHARYRTLLTDAERAQESRFHFASDRLRYLVTRALVRTVLSRYVPIAPADWTFSTDAYGRPEIANELADDPPLSFNISHTRSLIVLAVSRKRALGVDVENSRDRKVSMDIANRFFSQVEASDLFAIPNVLQHDRFFEYWTFKESYIKARGMGLSIPLDKFSFRYPNDRSVEISILPELGDDAARWQFWQFRPAPEYLVAVCAEQLESAPQVTVKRIIPLSNEEPLHVEFLRTCRGGL
jgi:4'-phosphopantetheinyl transferase